MTGLAHRIARIGTLIVLITCLGCIEHSDPLQAGAVRDSGTANTPENGKDTGIWNDTGDTAPPGCSAILDTSDWELCATGPSYCAAVFDDAAGCLAVCEAVGLECSAVYENVDGECAPDETRPALSCNPPSGHQSDYCVCSGEPEVGNDEPPESEEDECDGYPYSADTLWAERAGYGAAATGGDPDNIYHVTTLADGGSGSLRAALESDQDYWIVFDVEGGITHIDPVRITSNKTVDGRGRSITVEGELRLEDAENVILSDLSLTNQLEEPCGQDGDVISIRGTGGRDPRDFSSRNIWVHHVELYEGGDGLLDIRGGTDITLSWSHLHSHMKGMLNSYDVDGATTEGMQVTYHHNYFERLSLRGPQIHYGRAHFYNNYQFEWYEHGAASVDGAQLYSESNIYQARAGTISTTSDPNECGDYEWLVSKKALVTEWSDYGSGYTRSEGDLALEGADISVNEPSRVFNPDESYSYSAEAATDSLARSLVEQAGPRVDYCQ